MPKIVILLADGFEEVEVMAIVDVLRRAEIEVTIVGLHECPVTSARKVSVLPDTGIDTMRAEDFDMIVLPGGTSKCSNHTNEHKI